MSLRTRLDEIAACTRPKTMDARALTADALTEGARRSTLDEMSEWTIWADKVLSF